MSDETSQKSPSHSEHGGGEHSHDTKLYWWVFGALCLLTTASAVTYFPFWRNSIPVQVGWAFMMAVSCAKAMLVITFFMHLLWEANWKYVLTIPAAFMSVFLVCMLIPDVGRRTVKYSETRARHVLEESSSHGHESGSHSGANNDGGNHGAGSPVHDASPGAGH